MAYRMACEFSDVIAGIASRAGTTTLGETNCRPSQPVNVLHIHGTADDVVPYAGGRLRDVPGVTINTPPATGALQVVQLWASFNGCNDPVTDAAPSLDLDLNLAGENLPMKPEYFGDGAAGAKASGLLMLDETLFMLLRNVGNSRLLWSIDRGRTWTAVDWKFNTSFGCPTCDLTRYMSPVPRASCWKVAIFFESSDQTTTGRSLLVHPALSVA